MPGKAHEIAGRRASPAAGAPPGPTPAARAVRRRRIDAFPAPLAAAPAPDPAGRPALPPPGSRAAARPVRLLASRRRHALAAAAGRRDRHAPAGSCLYAELFRRLSRLTGGRLRTLSLTDNRRTILSVRPVHPAARPAPAPSAPIHLRIHRSFAGAPDPVLRAVAAFLASAKGSASARQALAAIREHFHHHRLDPRSPGGLRSPQRTAARRRQGPPPVALPGGRGARPARDRRRPEPALFRRPPQGPHHLGQGDRRKRAPRQQLPPDPHHQPAARQLLLRRPPDPHSPRARPPRRAALRRRVGGATTSCSTPTCRR